MNDEQIEAQGFYDDLCREIGIAVLRFAPLLDRLGWANTAAARTYLHSSSLPTAVFIDFLDVVRDRSNAPEAMDRLRVIADAWGLTEIEVPDLFTV